MNSSENLLILFLTIFVGTALGRLRWRGFSFGSAGVLLVALGVGHLGFTVPESAGTLGLVVFVYCLGISAGPRFFRMLVQHGGSLAVVGITMIMSAMLATWLFAESTRLPADLAAGIFAGSLTSTPALAAASEVLAPDSQLAVGFGIAYPIGALGMVLFVQFAPSLFGRASSRQSDEPLTDSTIVRKLVEVLNPAVVGRQLSEMHILDRCNTRLSRVLIGEQMQPVPAGFTLKLGQQLLLVGTQPNVALATDVLGKSSPKQDFILDAERHRRRVVATSSAIVGHSANELQLHTKYGVTITRIARHDVEFVPDVQQVIEFGDALTVVGEPADLQRFVQFAGHRERSFDETDLISLAFGLVVGVLLGRVQFQLGGESISLGLAGGPLFVGLILGHFGRIGPVVGHYPRAAKLLLTEIGLTVFLASAGVAAGGKLLPVIQQHGLILILGAVVITSVPLAVGILLTTRLLRMDLYRSLGGICGAMTSTPALGVLTTKTDSNVPITAYAAVYPLALIMMSLFAPILISLISQ